MFGEIDGTYVVSGIVVSGALVFDYIAVRLKGCGYNGTREGIVTRSFWAEEVDVLTGCSDGRSLVLYLWL